MDCERAAGVRQIKGLRLFRGRGNICLLGWWEGSGNGDTAMDFEEWLERWAGAEVKHDWCLAQLMCKGAGGKNWPVVMQGTPILVLFFPLFPSYLVFWRWKILLLQFDPHSVEVKRGDIPHGAALGNNWVYSSSCLLGLCPLRATLTMPLVFWLDTQYQDPLCYLK